MTEPPRDAPGAPASAARVFGQREELALSYARLLASTGVDHGLVGPREVPRLWERHLLNCAVVQELVPTGVRLVDVGSGAGLPGLVLAIARPDLEVHLVEAMQRRVRWLLGAVAELGLDNVTVHRSRAQELAGKLSAPVVTARAVAPLGLLATWCQPLLAPGGRLLALKGASAREEVTRDAATLARLGLRHVDVRAVGETVVQPPTVVVVATRPPHRGVVRE